MLLPDICARLSDAQLGNGDLCREAYADHLAGA